MKEYLGDQFFIFFYFILFFCDRHACFHSGVPPIPCVKSDLVGSQINIYNI